MGDEIQKEQRYLDMVMADIARQIGVLEADAAKRKEEVIHIRKHFWDDLKINMDTFDDYLETIIGMRQQAQDLSVSQGTHRQAFHRLERLKRVEEVPYFGRIDFREEGQEEAESVHIGISTITDEADESILIYDWRAPISSVYYDYAPGPAAYHTPEGRIHGELEKKWQYNIKNGVIESMFDTSVTIGDEILQGVLGQGSNKHMQSIVATIQKEQNKIIRHVKGKLLMVHGAAGSGKTSAALQRIAYFLYKFRENLRADQIILFSPNAMFSNYVSHVLPELGEENMEQETFQDYLEYRLQDSFSVEGPYEQLEYMLECTDDPDYGVRRASAQFKASSVFFEGMKTYRDMLESSGMIFRGLKFRGKSLVKAADIAERFYTEDTNFRFNNRIEKLKDWLLEMIDRIEVRELEKPWVQEEIELLSKDDLQKVYSRLDKEKEYEDGTYKFYEKEQEVLSRLIVRRRLKPLRRKIEALQFIHIKNLYRQIFDESLHDKLWDDSRIPDEWSRICEMTKEALKEGKLYQEDATPYLLLKELIQGFQSNNAIKYVLIDEAQDYSVFQFEFIKRLFPRARMTVLGDFNQAIFAHADQSVNFDFLSGLYGPEETESITLDRSYRSTKQIIEFTRELVPEGEQIKAFEREGEKPTLTTLDTREELHAEIVSRVAALKQEGHHTIAIICKSARESADAFEGLGAVDDLKLVKKSTDEYEQGVVVLPSYLAKGIEFDAVLIYDASDRVYGEEHLRRLFYTACTRAMHTLYLYSVGEPTRLLNGVSLGTVLAVWK
ncbi:RNA polymerase recycling motor HelD [Halobacillus sp. BAB-2008]|uniref:RNA polymerase recycling motor HelD n=1 Tax=Halobacillus sp. BAB-2008 TaxID=1246484 RepID=UPI0002A4F505|nr:RNA polymerase recycling motor HelD [Halobacillus sp. BAB-2008]ELK45983.1 ATP-dependent DNA helicase replicase [Halobacillus sp. BAB-2008]